MKLQIRFDGPPGPVCGRFIEVEDEKGRSICIGEWVQEGKDWILKVNTDELPYEKRYREEQAARIAEAELEAQGIDPDYEAVQADRP